MTSKPDLTDISQYDFFEPVTLRYSDQDSMGHINNVAYAALFEAGRLGLFLDLFKSLGDSRQDFVLAHLGIDYLQEMHFPGTVQVGEAAESRHEIRHQWLWCLSRWHLLRHLAFGECLF